MDYIKNIERLRKRSVFPFFPLYVVHAQNNLCESISLIRRGALLKDSFCVTWRVPQQVLFKTGMCVFRSDACRVYAHGTFCWGPLSAVSSSEHGHETSVWAFQCHSVADAPLTSWFLYLLVCSGAWSPYLCLQGRALVPPTGALAWPGWQGWGTGMQGCPCSGAPAPSLQIRPVLEIDGC